MAREQKVLFTVMPRGVAIDSATLPVSIFVSPRLNGANELGAFPDWMLWTRRLKEDGLKLELQCGAQRRVFAIDQDPLEPDLWEQLFRQDTYVRSHKTFDDYDARGCLSFPMRQTLSALKSIYQEASVELALPEKPFFGNRERKQFGNRQRLGALVDGLQVHWDGRQANELRSAVRNLYARQFLAAQQRPSGPLDREGLITGQPKSAALNHAVALPFAVFHHMPTPEYGEGIKLPDDNKLIDFHQALTSLNSYPALLRALGLVFDLDLPRSFVAATPSGTPGALSVRKVISGWDSRLEATSHPLRTAYLRFKSGDHEFFFTAPRVSDPEGPHDFLGVLGLLNLDPAHFGLAQVDVDGAMHKTIMLAETLHPSGKHNLVKDATPQEAQHPEVFDPEATLPSLRSGGFSLYADNRALQLLESIHQSKQFNNLLGSNQTQHRPFYAEDLIRGYRLDVWDSRTNAWHSLHLRRGKYRVGDLPFTPGDEPEEGFVQLAVTQSAPGAENATKDLYVHEAIARWAGWSLSVSRPGKHLSRYANADDAIPRDDDPEKFAEDQPVTPFRVTAHYKIAPKSLPLLRFGLRYRLRARAVDLAGNSLRWDDKLAESLAPLFALPRDAEGFVYLRYEPVPAPLIVIRDKRALTDLGSAVDRLVIRTFNKDISKDTAAAKTTAADRHIIPPRASIEMGERLSAFDDASGKLKSDAATWKLIADRDRGELSMVKIAVAGGDPAKEYPLESNETIDELPFFPDPLSRGAALRDLPGTPDAGIGNAIPDTGAAASVDYQLLSDPNPRPGSATLISFGDTGNWQDTHGFRFVLTEPAIDQDDVRPHWDPIGRVLTVFLPKGETKVIPLTSYMSADDLKLMGVWQWLREYIENVTEKNPRPPSLQPGSDLDRIAHVLQRAVEGGHWMLTPPHLVTLVHATQQPIGRPEFTALHISHATKVDRETLQTAPDRGPTDPTQLAPITAWRRLGSTEAYLLGALKIHGASTAKVDLRAEWNDPVDDTSKPKWERVHFSAPADELPLPAPLEGPLVLEAEERAVGYYDLEHDQIAFVRADDRPALSDFNFSQAAPRHFLNDTKRHIVRYTATATSRFREYFKPDLDFTRSSEPVEVDVPASGRPLAPDVVYVVPTFGWERQTATNLKRSVRFGGGLRVYLNRPWFSSGEGELLGVALWSGANGSLDENNRDKFKPFFTQWGMDPIWQTAALSYAPSAYNFPDAEEKDWDVSLEEGSARQKNGDPGRASVVGFAPQFDESRGLWFADLTINLPSETYMPFVRLALVRYQPHALADAKISRVVLADFAQLTPDRSATVTSDPHHARTIRVAVSGVAPRGPQPIIRGQPPYLAANQRPTKVRVRVQERDQALQTEVAWRDVPQTVAKIDVTKDGAAPGDPDLTLWLGTITFSQLPEVGRYRLLIQEYEYISANYMLGEGHAKETPGRLIYAEVFELDDALISET
jgi:hypothetical protein